VSARLTPSAPSVIRTVRLPQELVERVEQVRADLAASTPGRPCAWSDALRVLLLEALAARGR